MPLFVVAYDLKTKKGESRNYGPIEAALEALDSCHTQESVWYVDFDGTADQIIQYLEPNMKAGDFLMVVEFSKRPDWTNADIGTDMWLYQRFG